MQECRATAALALLNCTPWHQPDLSGDQPLCDARGAYDFSQVAQQCRCLPDCETVRYQQVRKSLKKTVLAQRQKRKAIRNYSASILAP